MSTLAAIDFRVFDGEVIDLEQRRGRRTAVTTRSTGQAWAPAPGRQDPRAGKEAKPPRGQRASRHGDCSPIPAQPPHRTAGLSAPVTAQGDDVTSPYTAPQPPRPVPRWTRKRHVLPALGPAFLIGLGAGSGSKADDARPASATPQPTATVTTTMTATAEAEPAPPPHPEAARLPQPDRVRGEALRRPGSDRTSEPETTSTRSDQLVSHSRTAGEPHHGPCAALIDRPTP